MLKLRTGNYFIYAVLALVGLLVISANVPILLLLVQIAVVCFLALLLVDVWLLYAQGRTIEAERHVPARMSNGDKNPVELHLNSTYPMPTKLEIVDEIPHQFQRRDLCFDLDLEANSTHHYQYELKPKKRGIYNFGKINIYVQSPLQLLKRKIAIPADKDVAVYPSFLQLKKYELVAFARNNMDHGLKRTRKLGNTLEFEQIRDYVIGDDPRHINWKATARRSQLMINQFQDQKAQHIISVIDKGRLMKMPFQGMTLLDYAINSCLVMSNIAIKKGDKAGVLSYATQLSGYIPADRNSKQMHKIQEFLYAQRSKYGESNVELLQKFVRKQVHQRSLLILYTNFESKSGLDRQLEYFRQLNRRHVLLVVFFKNTGMQELLQSKVRSVRDVYTQVLGEKSQYERMEMVKKMRMHGIYCILTSPEDLTIGVLNKYLELKARSVI